MSQAIELVPASLRDAGALAALFGAVYADYYLPLHVDIATFEAMVRWFDLDLERSRIALRAGEPVGIAMLGRRGDSAWIGGMGVVPAARRSGAGRALMRAVIEEARAGGARRVQLEVLEQNAPAIALYEALGFKTWRDVEVWSFASELADAGARPIDAEDALEWIDAHRADPEPWQRATESLRRMARPETPLRGLEVVEGGERVAAGAVLANAGRASLLQAATRRPGDTAAARALVAGARAWGSPVRTLNYPAAGAVAGAMRALGATREAGQLEMVLELDGAAASA